MQRLNYHHLRYFWFVAKEGSIVQASKMLHVAHPTISAQIHQLEDLLGKKLFVRQGRQLVLTDFGRVALRYADDIFGLGRELLDVSSGRPGGKSARLEVGVLDCLPKSMVYRILEPAFNLTEPVRLIVREDNSAEAFIGELATHLVELVLTDRPAPANLAIRVFTHKLGECGTAFFAAPKVAKAARQNFPRSLDGQPFLMPSPRSVLLGNLQEWFDDLDIAPRIAGNFDDLALAEVIGESGYGVFAAPDVIEAEILRRYRVHLVGRVRDMRHRYYAISLERKIKHPAVLAICDGARREVFAGGVGRSNPIA